MNQYTLSGEELDMIIHKSFGRGMKAGLYTAHLNPDDTAVETSLKEYGDALLKGGELFPAKRHEQRLALIEEARATIR